MTPSNSATRYGFRIVGNCTNDRRLIDWPSAFVAYSQCDDRAEVNREAYLSAFCFGDAFANHLNTTGSTKGYIGECGADWLWLDIDRDDIDDATTDARRLAAGLVNRYEITGDDLLCFFSGSKGYHIGLPLSVCGSPMPSVSFHATCRRFAESIAAQSNVAIDSGVYDRVRAFRAPNSRHGKTERYKRYFAFDELMGLRVSRIIELAETPEPFEIPEPPEPNGQAVRDWAAAGVAVDEQRQAVAVRRDIGTPAKLNRATMAFICDGVTLETDANGQPRERYATLFSAAANLAEFQSIEELAFALLTEPGLDSGLSPSKVNPHYSPRTC